MAQQIIETGTVANDGTGDKPRPAGIKINENFTELYANKIETSVIIDEDDMVSDSAAHVPTQQSVKAYVDSSVGGGGHTIEDEGTPLTQRTKLNFVGAGVTVTDDSGDDASVVTINGTSYTAATFGDFLVSLTGKTTPIDADVITISDSADSDDAKKVTLTNFKAFLKTYFDTLYAGLTSNSASTAGGTITLDMNSEIQRMFYGSATFSAAKIIALSNTTNALVFNFIFEVTNVAAVLTMPADFLLSDANFDGDDWTPPLVGKYEMGGSWNGTNWYVKMAGPFS